MTSLKSCPSQVTLEEVERAAEMWGNGLRAKAIFGDLEWTENLFTRVVRISREAGEDHFPRRHKGVPIEPGWDSEVLRAAKKPAKLTPKVWKRELQGKGLKPSTVRTRRPSDYLAKRKLVDPTLSLPERRA